MLPRQKELDLLSKQLSECYVSISTMYLKMSKTTDAYSLGVLQSGVDGSVKTANRVYVKRLKRRRRRCFDNGTKEIPAFLKVNMIE